MNFLSSLKGWKCTVLSIILYCVPDTLKVNSGIQHFDGQHKGENRLTGPKSSIEVTKCTSSNILVWFGRDAPEESVAGLRESLFLVLLKNFQKYRK